MQTGRTYKHNGTGELVHLVARCRNHFDGSAVYVYESSLAPGEYLYRQVGDGRWENFERCRTEELKQWFANYKENYGLGL